METPRTTPQESRRSRRLKPILVTLVVLLAVGVAFGLYAWYWVRSGRLDRYIAGEVKTALVDYGLRADIGKFETSWTARTIRASDVAIYNQQTNQLIASVKQAEMVAEIPQPYALSLRRQIIFKRLDLSGAQIHIDIDKQGRSNFRGLKQPPPVAQRITFDYSTLTGKLADGTLHLNDQAHDVKLEVNGLQGQGAPTKDGHVNLTITSSNGQVWYEGRSSAIDQLAVEGLFNESGATVKRFDVKGAVAQLGANGKIDWDKLTYEVDVRAQASLAETVRLLAPGEKASGDATFNGRVAGSKDSPVITGSITAGDVLASGARVRGIRLDDLRVEPQVKQTKFTVSQARAQSLVYSGTTAINLLIARVTGEYRDGLLNATASQASASQVDLKDGRVSGVALRTLEGSSRNARYRVRGALAVESAKFEDVQIGKTTGRLTLDNSSVALESLNTSISGGTASGNALIQFGRNGRSSAALKFNDLKSADLARLAGISSPLAGQLEGQADLSWPGVEFKQVSGSASLQFTGETVDTPQAIPVTGTVAIKAQNGSFDIDQLDLATRATKLTGRGRLVPKGNSDITFELSSTSGEELQTLASSIDILRETINDYEPTLSGQFDFKGHFTGTFDKPVVEGDLSAESAGIHSQALGKLTGHVLFSPDEARGQDVALTTPAGGTARASFRIPFDPKAETGTFTATVDKIDVQTLLNAAGLTIEQKAVLGELSGNVNITGLPGAPRGDAGINLVNATLLDQPVDSVEAKVHFDGKSARIERTELKLPQGRLVASGTLNFEDDSFALEGQASEIDLGRVVEATGLTTTRVTGSADGTFKARGKTTDLGQLEVELTAQGKDVVINGRPSGELKVNARTSANGRIDLDVVTGITGSPQPLHASLELRQPGRPIEVQSTLTNYDFAPLIAIFEPELANSIAGHVTGELRVTGPIENAQGEFTLDRLQGGLTLSEATLDVSGTPVKVQTPLSVELSASQIKLSQTHFSGSGVDLDLGGTISLKEDKNLAVTLKGTVRLERLPQFDPDVFINGELTIDASFSGKVSDPRIGGEAQLKAFSISAIDLPIVVEQGSGRAVFNADQMTVSDFTARANDGSLQGQGVLKLDHLRPSEWNFTLKATDIEAYYRGARIVMNSDLALTGKPTGQVLSGTIRVPQAEYAVDLDLGSLVSRHGGGIGMGFLEGSSKSTSNLAPLTLDLRLEAPESIVIRNQQINTVASASLTLSGPASDPSPQGRINTEGGTWTFRDRRYQIVSATLDFLGGFSTVPNLHLLAEGDVGNTRVYIGIDGPINDLTPTLRSEPSLSYQEILGLITTGRTDLNTFSNDPLRSGFDTAASLITEQFFSKPVEKETQQLGISRFQIDPVLRPNQDPAARLTIGRQLTRDLLFTYSTNLASEQDQTALLEYNLTNRFSAIAAYSQGGVSSGQQTHGNIFTIEVRTRKSFSLGLGGDANASSAPRRQPTLTPSRPALPKASVTVEEITGLKISDKKVRELIPVASQGYSRSLAGLGERNLTEFLQERGFFLADVHARCEPADCSGSDLKVLYDIDPGARYDLAELRIEGTHQMGLADVSGDLASQKASPLGNVPFLKSLPFIGGYARGLTSNDRLRRDRETIRRFMVDLGFRSATVESNLAVKPDSDDLVVIFKVNEGPRSTVADVAVRGNSLVASGDLRSVVPVYDEEEFSPTRAKDGTTRLKDFYSQRGYLDATVALDVIDLPGDRVRLMYDIREGRPAVVSEIVISGYTKSSGKGIRNLLDFKPGDVLTPAKIRRSQRDLYSTNAFREVTLRTETIAGSSDESLRRVIVNVAEAKPLLLVYGLGYSTEDRVRGLLEISNTNLLNRVTTAATLRLRASSREQLAQILLTELRPFGSHWATTFSIFYDRNSNLIPFVQRKLVNGDTENVSYGQEQAVAFIQTARRINDQTSIRFSYNYERSHLFNFENIPDTSVTRSEQNTRLGYISAGFSRDSRDSVLNPTKGQLMSADYSLASTAFGGRESYNKFLGTFQRTETFGRRVPGLANSAFFVSARVGLAAQYRPTDRDGNGTINLDETLLPISQRFFAGGATTLRGFRYYQAGPQEVLEPTNPNELPTLAPIGGDALLVFNFEWRYPIYKRLRLVPFYDWGNVFLRISDISLRGMTNTVGLGLRIDTPLGPIGVDYGFLIDPPAFVTATGAVLRQPRGAFHIRFGQTF
jgi:outer membrane protein assembly complex protein YaeT